MQMSWRSSCQPCGAHQRTAWLNYDEGTCRGGERWTLNVQPVVPISLNADWNVIREPSCRSSTRTSRERAKAVLATSRRLFLLEKPTASGWIIGGTAFLLPTASKDELGTERWAIGPTMVALKQTADGWTYGALWNYLISVAGDDNRADVNSTFFQPFLAKGIGKGRTLTVNLESSYDFEGDHWSIPVNFVYSRVTKIGGQMVSFAGGARYYLDSPPGGPDWGLRFVVTLLYPK